MGKWLRRVALALLCSLLAGFALGTCLRHPAERPTVYIGRADAGTFLTRELVDGRSPGSDVAESSQVRASGTSPLDVRDAGAAVLDAGEDEEQVGEAVQVAERHGR